MRGKGRVADAMKSGERITPAYAGKSVFIDTLFQLFKDHPRLCGEKKGYCADLIQKLGSPPPMRGKGRPCTAYRQGGRITPAYAGKSALQSPQNPRSSGSPPPMRGKGVTVGITPAYAGKRRTRKHRGVRLGDHPRLCGEKMDGRNSDGERRGSPPPMRGKVFTGSFQCYPCRITPAYAGKSSNGLGKNCAEWDHPRLCGEKRQRAVTGNIELGSPPPMRGKVCFCRCDLRCQGSPPPMRGKAVT